MSTSNTQLNHLRIPLDKIQKATNNFSEKNIIGKGDFGYIYEGQLLHTGEIINVSARRLDRSQGLGDVEFWKEISVLSSLEHPNIVSLIGFCDEKGEKIIITRHEAKGSLGMYLSDPALTWIQRLNISIGVARAIEYIHYEEGRNYYIIHRNINSSTILLDDNFEAKLSGFEFSINDSMDRMERYIPLEFVGTQGYMDPETIKSGYVTQKSDIYSFGVVLCELMCGRRAFLPDASEGNKFLAPLVRFHDEKKRLQDIINPDIFNQMTTESLERFAAAAYYCIETDPLERPHMTRLLSFLSDAVHRLEPPPDYSHVQLPMLDELPPDWTLQKVNNLDHLRIGLKDIQKATKNFSKKFKLRSHQDDDVYEGILYFSDRKNISSLEGKNTGGLPKKPYRVIIKHMKNEYHEAKFHAEIEILSTCKHENIVTLLGFCDESDHMILVYEGREYEFLSDHLSSRVLTWGMRVKICLDIAHGLNYIHNEMEDQKMVIHRGIYSDCILLDDDSHGVQIDGFGRSTFFPSNQDKVSDFLLRKTTKESDIHSFGIVMCDILCGKTYPYLDSSYLPLSEFEFRAEDWCKERIIKPMVAQVVREENRGNNLFLKKGPNVDSLETFIKITEQCLAVNPEQRPTLKVIIKQLEKALLFQDIHKDHLRMSFKDIESATQNFGPANDIGGGGFGRVYKGKLAPKHGSYKIVAKRLNTLLGQGDQQFYNELHILSEYKHENVIGLVGYNNDEEERIIVYELASKGSLDNYLNDASLTWINRLNICVDVAKGLAFLHGGVQEHEAVIHRDMKTANILLFDDWKAKVADFGLSLICTISDETDYVIDHVSGTRGYCDPVYQKSGFLTKESDIYSLGVVLFEILYGKSTYEIKQREKQFLQSLVQQRLEEGRLDEVVFNAIKNQIVPEALATFQAIAYQCLHDDREKRPTAQHVLVQLLKALELQVVAYEFLQDDREKRPTTQHVLVQLQKQLILQKNHNKDQLRMSFKDIESATQNFSRANEIGGGGFGRVYKGKLASEHGSYTIVARRYLDASLGQGDQQFKNELHILSEYKHENVISLVGYNNDEKERIIVYEYASKGSLDNYLSDASLSWINRLNICIDVARGLAFLHGGVRENEAVIHRDMKTANILLFDYWKAKVSDFGLSLICTTSVETDYVIDYACGTPGYLDPLDQKSRILTKESDIYSFGVVLLEILCGRSTYEVYKHEGQFLQNFVIQLFEEKSRLEEVLFNGIKNQIGLQSLEIYLTVAFQCLDYDRENRPTTQHVLAQLQKALELQVMDETTTTTTTNPIPPGQGMGEVKDEPTTITTNPIPPGQGMGEVKDEPVCKKSWRWQKILDICKCAQS